MSGEVGDVDDVGEGLSGEAGEELVESGEVGGEVEGEEDEVSGSGWEWLGYR